MIVLNSKKLIWPMVAMIVIVTATALRPGDAPWFFDEARMINIALQYNATPSHPLGISLPFTPSDYGLLGSRVRYGPLPIWIDQIFLCFTRNPIAMIAFRSVITCSATAIALVWLTRTLRISPWLAVVTMLSPWMWYYNREIWDNSLNVPISAMAVAAYADFLNRRRASSLYLGIICALAMTLIHLMSLALIIPLGIHLLFFETKSALKYKWGLIAIFAGLAVISVPYLHYLATHPSRGSPEYLSRIPGWYFAVFGPQHMTARNVGYIIEKSWHRIEPSWLAYPWVIVQGITLIGLIAGWAGMAMGIPKGLNVLRRRTSLSAADHLCFIGWATFFCQTIIDGIGHVYEHPHYYNATWVVFAIFVWLALDSLPRWFGSRSLIARFTLPAYAAALFCATAMLAFEIAHDSGTRDEHYSTVISNQMEVARVMANTEPGLIKVEVPEWIQRPEMPENLIKLIGKESTRTPNDKPIVIRYRNAFSGDATIVATPAPLTVPATFLR